MKANPDGPQAVKFLEVQRRVVWIGLQELAKQSRSGFSSSEAQAFHLAFDVLDSYHVPVLDCSRRRNGRSWLFLK